ncbi:branched-chain-amino-acid transaminase [Clostridia bacterium]|nr:branched-chain-amino-acid transaminase [Clostridia bacterium]
MIIYLNGKYVPKEQAVVSVFDHGLLYGDGIFEGIRAYHNRVFKMEEHIDRLYESAKSIMLNIGMSKDEMTEVVLETMRKNDLREGYIRLLVTRGVGDLGLDPNKCPKASVICIAADIQLYPAELYQKGLKISTVATRRNISEGVNPRIKSLNYMNNILAKIEAVQMGCAEALMLNNEGYVAEATGDNVFLVKKGTLLTPPSSVGALEGVTRNTVMELAEKRGLKVKEALLTRHDVYNADECFLTGSAAEVIPVVSVDGRQIGDGTPGETTMMLNADFGELTKIDGPEIF